MNFTGHSPSGPGLPAVASSTNVTTGRIICSGRSLTSYQQMNIMDVPAGRGRGRTRLSENPTPMSPLRRPHNTDEDELRSKLNKLRLNVVEGDTGSTSLKDVTSHIRSVAKNEDDLTKITETIHKFGEVDRSAAKHVALIYQELADLEVGSKKFRTLLLQKLQQDFKEKEEIVKNREKFLNLAVLLCEVFHLLKANGVVYEFLCIPVIEYMKILLKGSSDNEIEVMTEQFTKNGKDLEKHAEKEFKQLLLTLREKLISDNLISPSSRKRLLFCLEYSLNKWTNIPPEVQSIYN